MARGRIEIDGTVTADGYHPGPPGSGGSGGSILLRGLAGVSVLQGGTVTALGGNRHGVPLQTVGAPGYVRLDAWGAPPVIQGTVTPAPTVLDLPYLRAVASPQIGIPCLLQVFAPEPSTTWLGVSLRPDPGTTTPFGVVGIALGGAMGIGVGIVPYPGATPLHDPRANVLWPVPNTPALRGVPIWIQGLTLTPNLPPRLTNTVPVLIG